MLIFIFGSGLAGVAGAVLAPIKSVSTTMGFPYAVDSYMVLVLGGVGSLWGVLTGGALIGESETILSFVFNNVIGNPLETTVFLSHLIFEGVFDRFPGLRICGAHAGGYLPSYSGRSDAVDDPLGPAGIRQDHPGLYHLAAAEQAFLHTERDQLGGQGGARGDRRCEADGQQPLPVYR